MDANQLRQDVIEELEFDPRFEAAHIGIAAEDGVVTVTGHVSSYAEKTAVIAAVKRVNGVRGIAEEIEIRYPSDKKTSDDEIARRSIDILRWDTLVPRDAIQVMVRNGWVTLAGEVDWQYQRRAAEDDIRKLSGVLGVLNTITLRPQVQPGNIKQRIEGALRRRAELEAGSIRVTVHDGNRVTLEGKVDNWDEREAVENAAWSTAGVTAVEDRLTVGH